MGRLGNYFITLNTILNQTNSTKRLNPEQHRNQNRLRGKENAEFHHLTDECCQGRGQHWDEEAGTVLLLVSEQGAMTAASARGMSKSF